jgi:hypothetical protein
MSTLFDKFDKPQPDEVENWYIRWLQNRRYGVNRNPFHPTDVDQFWGKDKDGVEIWKKEMANEGLIYCAGLIATTRPCKEPSQISNLDAIVAGAEAKAVYADGNGSCMEKLPSKTRTITISIDKGDTRDFYIPVSSELATATKYPKQADKLSELAKRIIDREEENEIPPVFVQFENKKGKEELTGGQLKSGFRVSGTLALNIPTGNFGLLPPGEGPAAYYDYAVKLKHNALEQGQNKLRFGVNGDFFSYEVEYNIVKAS